MVAFFKRDIAHWMDGTEKLSHEAYRAYDVILNLIYLNEGPITFNERGLAGRASMSVKLFMKAVAELRELGKVTVENGKISNERARKELQFVETNRENAKLGGKNSGKSRNASRKPLKNNEPDEATLQQDRSLIDKTRLEKTLSSGALKKKAIDEAFDRFWSLYPKRKGDNPEAPARKAFEKLVRSGVDSEVIIAGLQKAVEANCDKVGTEFIPKATTWLNEKRYQQYASAKANGHANEHRSKELTEKAWRFALDDAERNGGIWQSRQVKKSDIPAEFIKRWQQERSAPALPLASADKPH